MAPPYWCSDGTIIGALEGPVFFWDSLAVEIAFLRGLGFSLFQSPLEHGAPVSRLAPVTWRWELYC
jgi:hypothetical protein